jgi:Flp pilus assembly pilin Flp
VNLVLLSWYVRLRVLLSRDFFLAREEGQTTAEYALVILGAAALATMVIAWATHSNAVGRLFDAVLNRVLGSAG